MSGAQNGWQREEPGSGWWFHDQHDEGTIGDAVFQQLEADGLDTRYEPQVVSPKEGEPG